MRKGNLVRIKKEVLTGHYRTRFTSFEEQAHEESGGRTLRGRWPTTAEEREAWRTSRKAAFPDARDELPPCSKNVRLDASVYLLEAARVCARDIEYDYYHSGAAIIRDLKTGSLCYVERELLEPINKSKRFRLRECVVKKQWVLEKAK